MTKEDEARLKWFRENTPVDRDQFMTCRWFLLRLLDEARVERDAADEKVRIAHVVRDEALARRDDVLKLLEHSATHMALIALAAENREQAARVAAIEKAGNALAECHRQVSLAGGMGSKCSFADEWEAAIRARAGEATITGSPACMRCGGPAESTETEGKCWVTASVTGSGEASEFGTIYPVAMRGRCVVAPGEVKP